MKNTGPLIVRVAIEQKSFDIDAVDTHVYCINPSQIPMYLNFVSESFTTIDEETGETVNHGSGAHSFILNPKQVILIEQVHGWEWDGHVGFELKLNNTQNKTMQTFSYNLKHSTGDYFIESINKQGRLILPIKPLTRI